MNELVPAAVKSEILHRLNSSSKPLSKTKLVEGKGAAAREMALPLLVKAGQIVNLGSRTRTAFIAAPEGVVLDLTEKTEKLILDLQPVKPTPLSLTKLKQMVEYRALQDQVITAAANLVKKNLAIMFKCGSGTYFLHLAPIRHLLNLRETASEETPIVPPSSDRADIGQIIVSNYRELARQSGTPDISIASLVQSSGLPLPVVHKWIISECSAQRASPSKGEPTWATPEEKNAALTLDGETFYLIRLIR